MSNENQQPLNVDLHPHDPTRRQFMRLAGGLAVSAPLLGLPAHALAHDAARAAPATRAGSNCLWFAQPAARDHLLLEGLPVGNGHLGALVSGDPGRDIARVTTASMWHGGPNDRLLANGQFPYATDNFGGFTQMAALQLDLPGHALERTSAYRRELDLAHGCARVQYDLDGVHYRRELFASHPDKVLVLHVSHEGGGTYSGQLKLTGMHGESTRGDASATRLHCAGQLANGLHYATVVSATSDSGRVSAGDGVLHFDNCQSLVIVLAAATNYSSQASSTHFIDPAVKPLDIVNARLTKALTRSLSQLRQRHVDDHRALFDTMQVDLGQSLPAQRKLDTWSRLQARARSGVPDPELEALYLQFGRYLTIAGSRDSLPTNLQGLWLASNEPPWHSDYHTDVNVQMNYWLPDRAGLGACFDSLANFCLAQLDAWTRNTRRWFNNPRNAFANTSGKIAGWTVAISINPFGGNGWKWHPPGNAWLCNNLWHHYEYTLDSAYLQRILPLLEGACRFWQARLIEVEVTDPDNGQPRRVLVDDHDWSPEQGPEDARGITYAQELVWDLFGNYAEACRVLDQHADHAATISALRERLYLPRVSPVTGRLQEWMSPHDLGSPTHRHLSPLMGLFPGDRIVPGRSPEALVQGAEKLLEARGMHSFGWANAWRALCWNRLGNGEKSYRLLTNNLTPSRGRNNGTALNLFDVYHLPGNGVFQIDANYGMPAAMLDMLLYSRAGRIELLPALPEAWPAGKVTGLGARGGFVVDLTWVDSRLQHMTLHSIGGTHTTVVHRDDMLPVTMTSGHSLDIALTSGKLQRL